MKPAPTLSPIFVADRRPQRPLGPPALFKSDNLWCERGLLSEPPMAWSGRKRADRSAVQQSTCRWIVGRGGPKPFVPTQAQRDMVVALAAIPRPNKMIASLIINPSNGKPILRPTAGGGICVGSAPDGARCEWVGLSRLSERVGRKSGRHSRRPPEQSPSTQCQSRHLGDRAPKPRPCPPGRVRGGVQGQRTPRLGP